MSGSARSAEQYLGFALDQMQQHALNRYLVDWERIRGQATGLSAGAEGPEGTYAAIRWALGMLGDEHSFFSPPERGSAALAAGVFTDEVRAPRGHLREDGVAVVTVPSFRGSAAAVATFAEQLSGLVADGVRAGARGWIVDLTDNPGGNMLPMLTGLAPLLGPGCIGGFEFGDGSTTPWMLSDDGSLWMDGECVADPASPHLVELASAPVAVLTGPTTASSGEAVVVAFSGRPVTRRFGLPTRGLVTSNETYELPDGATLAITTARFADRTGRRFDGPIHPDVTVASPGGPPWDEAVEWVLGAG